ncbi:hypothetical protein DXG01_010620 [Tephrocybe rancida]|nr:hypothetical protein DXG01_010620 [Tephrocybe rancida]
MSNSMHTDAFSLPPHYDFLRNLLSSSAAHSPKPPTASEPDKPNASKVLEVQSSPSGTMQLPPPLDKSRFDNAYRGYCATKAIKHDPLMTSFEGRDIDLYMLHTHVMQEGGQATVTAQDSWDVIGGRMGFGQFPGTDTKPAKAGPELSQRLAQVYRDYLSNFDQVYINSVIDSKRKMQAAQAAQQHQQAQAAVAANVSSDQAQPQLGLLNRHQMQMVIGYANQSIEELRRQGVQEKVIQFVETNRAHLQRMFRGQFQNAEI